MAIGQGPNQQASVRADSIVSAISQGTIGPQTNNLHMSSYAMHEVL